MPKPSPAPTGSAPSVKKHSKKKPAKSSSKRTTTSIPKNARRGGIKKAASKKTIPPKTTKAAPVKESQLYLPIKKHFEALGYTVQGEVAHCDMVLLKGDELGIVELKLHFSMELILQAIDRQTIAEHVFIAIPRPKTRRGSRYRNMQRLVQRLDLGLIFVALDSPMELVELVRRPQNKATTSTQVGKRKKNAIIKEATTRRFDIALGGVTGEKIPTAYRERAIQVLCALVLIEEGSPAYLQKQYACPPQTPTILSGNPYGWFYRVSRGVYSITPQGHLFLEDTQFATIISFYHSFARERHTLPEQAEPSA